MPTCGEVLEDIEDMVSSTDLTPEERFGSRKNVVPRVRKKHKDPETLDPECDSVIPGTQSIYVKTWGCSHNNSDGEYMAGQLAAYGYTITDTPDAADLWLLNSCTVKNPAEDHFRNTITRAHREAKKVVVAGCVPQGQPKAKYLKGLSVIGVQQIDRVVEVVEETLKGHSVRLFGQKKNLGKKLGGAKLDLPKIRKNPLIEIIAINTGCLNQCTYCKTKHARGELGSYPPEEIVSRARQSFEEGVVEIWLTSEDTGAYGKDIGVTLPELLWRLVEVIPEGCMLRVGMTNPPYILEHLEEMAKILRHPQVYAFLHVPVQAASDSVLMDMRREYCLADFKQVVNFLKERVPNVTIATDVICGFPTETAEDFEETLQLVEEYKFPSLFINQFFPRPGTPAARMQRVDPQEVKRRTKAISELFQSYRPYDHKVGEIQDVLVTEESHDKKFYVAHNKCYDQVLVPKDEKLLGKMVTVEITSTGKHYLMGRLLSGQVTKVAIATPLPKGTVSGVQDNLQETTDSTTVTAQPPLAWVQHQLSRITPVGMPRWMQVAAFVLVLAVVLDLCRIVYRVSAKF
ncbi:PREDICTED: threonylcarbamoyladenosine tRNA methylthiotransferase-like [Branchiostoma belcheri]|uniref:tRNA-t(6)A37 methylthiotransferase n=1 Tax=Branchiostoma belcheri TaxID=7741 RepID=A0A6P5A6Z0_BRABE|nr:PREDICTED: threonylcarbamoyladenosine tRNA methylthiotransferase-like [Branchiostoma belcheri]